MTLLSQSFAYQLCLSMNHNPLWGLFILLNLAFAIYFTVDSIISWQSNPTVTSGKTVYENHSKSLILKYEQQNTFEFFRQVYM